MLIGDLVPSRWACQRECEEPDAALTVEDDVQLRRKG